MAEQRKQDTVQRLVREVAEALTPLADAVTRSPIPAGLVSLLAEAGVDVPGLGLSADELTEACQRFREPLLSLVELMRAPDAGADQIVQLVRSVVMAVRSLDSGGSSGTSVEVASERLLSFLISDSMRVRRPRIYALLRLLGSMAEPSSDDYSGFGPRIETERFAMLLRDSNGLLARSHGWGGESLDYRLLLDRVQQLLLLLGFPSIPKAPDEHASAALGADPEVAPSPSLRISIANVARGDQREGIGLEIAPLHRSGTPDAVIILPVGFGTGTGRFSLDDHWEIRVEFEGEATSKYALVLSPGNIKGVALDTDALDLRLKLGMTIGRDRPSGESRTLLRGPAGSSIEVGTLSLQAYASSDPPDMGVRLAGSDWRLVFVPDRGDGFLTCLLPQDGLQVAFALGVGWSRRQGLHIVGGGGLRGVIPVQAQLGPIHLEGVSVAVEAGSSARGEEVRGIATLSGRVGLGPFSASIEGIGAGAALAFRDGNLGPLDLSLRFIPPTGLGLTVEAGPVQGGGFVSFDEVAGRYAGVLDLELGVIGVQAIGLLDTRIPGQARSFALLVLLRASFPPIQLGFGFALSSVGGLLALNRRIDVDALRERMATGTAGRILAPEDPVRNAPLLLADMGVVFPPAEGVAVVGPTLRLSWAELVQFDIGVFLELPGPRRIVLLGSARAAVENPSGGRPYLQIRLDILGAADFAQHTVAFDAVLIDSHLLEVLDLTGGAAFRLSWGTEPYVVLTVGGFHPAYSPAPLAFPGSLSRVAMVRGAPTDVLYLRFEGYFAITTNTLQFGASVEVVINLGNFNIRGFLGFDALIRFEPVHFEFAIEASVKVRWKKHNLGGLQLRGRLSGPGPIVFHGRVCFEVLWFDICFEETFTLGSPSPPAVTPVPSALVELVRELEDPGNVRPVDAVDPWVVVEPAQGASLPVISPLGQAVWSQERAPLRLLLQRFEGAPLSQSETVSAAGPQVTGDEVDWFAPGGFTELTDADALHRRAFERLTAGVRLGVTGTDEGLSAQLEVKVRVIRLPAPGSVGNALSLPAWVLRAAAGRTGAVERDGVVPKLAVRDEEWALHSGAAVTAGLSQAQAHQLSRAAGGGAAVAVTDLVSSMAF
ncbi:DUF6603 domain-containing protein [Kocuria sp. M4R2S49]|uniref:DUF6603 domain-containing protein n=1 Tax=Kocuria rhizosphaericola TaxID=3376284 RepID=UPI0037B2B1AB